MGLLSVFLDLVFSRFGKTWWDRNLPLQFWYVMLKLLEKKHLKKTLNLINWRISAMFYLWLWLVIPGWEKIQEYSTRQENRSNQVFSSPSILPLYLLLPLLLFFFFLLFSLHIIFHSLFPLLNPRKDKNGLGNSFLLSVTLLFKTYAFYCGIMKRILKLK